MDVMEEFKKLAPYIAGSVKSKISDGFTDAEIVTLIHNEIVSFFATQQRLFTQYLSFTEVQRAAFAAAMYDALKPSTEEIKPSWNPKYLDYVERSGKKGALSYITGR